MLLLVFRGGVIAILALTTLQRNDFPHFWILFSKSAGRDKPARLEKPKLLDDLRDGAGADGVAAFANRETQALLKRHRSDQHPFAAYVVARHPHFHASRQLHIPCYVRGAEVKLRTIAGEKRRVPPAFFLRQHV